MKKINFTLLRYFTCFGLFFLFFFNLSAINFPQADSGKIDLSNWNFNEHAILKLSGKWQFFEGKLIKTYPSNNELPSSYINVPEVWNNQISGEYIKSGQGYGSYRLLISHNKKTTFSIKVNDIATSAKIWVNNKLYYTAGIVDTSAQKSKPQLQPTAFKLPNDTNFYEIVVEVANYSHKMGGLWDNIFIGKHEQIDLQHERDLIFNFFIYGAIFIIGFYHICLFFIKKNDYSSLNFGLFCFMISINVMSRNRILFYFFPEFNWELAYKIEYISLFLSLPLFYIFFYLSFKENFNKFFKTLSVVVLSIFCFITIITKVGTFSYLITPFHLLLALYAVVVVTSLTKCIYYKREGANIILVGFIIFFIAMTNDVLHGRNIINTTILMNYGVFAFVIIQSLFLAKKSVNALNKIEELSSNLKMLNKSLERFVPEAFFKILSKHSITEVSLGDSIEKKMTIMFSDIRSFTTISEKLKPQEAFEFINEYLKKMGPIIRKHHGFIDKYIGDGIMALFPENPEHAVNASIEMLEQLNVFNNENEVKNLPHIEIGVGIHTGLCMLGTVGEYERMDTTVISDSVNLAARIESLTKNYKTPILISEETYKGLTKKQNIKIRYVGLARVKGKSITTKLFEILVRYEYNEIELNLFNEGISKFYDKDLIAAKEAFSKLLPTHSEDGVLNFYMNRIERLLKDGILDNWNTFEIFDY